MLWTLSSGGMDALAPLARPLIDGIVLAVCLFELQPLDLSPAVLDVLEGVIR